MSMPIRCFTCNKVIAKVKYIEGYNDCASIEDEKERSRRIIEFFENHGIIRLCCKRMFTTVDISDSVLQYSELDDRFKNLKISKKTLGEIKE